MVFDVMFDALFIAKEDGIETVRDEVFVYHIYIFCNESAYFTVKNRFPKFFIAFSTNLYGICEVLSNSFFIILFYRDLNAHK